MRRTAKARKAEIVEAAISLAGTVGPDRITTAMIARKVGVSQPAVFRHFPKKNDIWTGVAEHLTGKIKEAGDEAAIATDDSVARIRAMIIGHLELIERNPALPAILFSRELHAGNAALRKVMLAAMNRPLKRLATLIEDAISSGRFRPGLDAGDAALLLIGLVQGLVLRWSISGRADSLVADGERLLTVQLGGFLAPVAPAILPVNRKHPL